MNGRKTVTLTDDQIFLVLEWANRAMLELEVERMKTVIGSAQEDVIQVAQEDVRMLKSVLKA